MSEENQVVSAAEQVALQVEDFLKRGGEIEVVPDHPDYSPSPDDYKRTGVLHDDGAGPGRELGTE